MNNKAIVIAVFVALMASMVGGAFTVENARADARPYGLYCASGDQSATSGQWVNFTAAYSSNYPMPIVAPTLTWRAVGGFPDSGTGSVFSTRFFTSSINETRVVTVTDGTMTATCRVFVYGPQMTYTPTPTPVSTLQCSPSYTNANSGDWVYFNAWGGNGSYSWRANSGSPEIGYGSAFSTRFYNYGTSALTRTATVTSGNQRASCTVSLYATYNPSPTPTYNYFSLDSTVRNLSRSGSGTSVNARNGDRLQFVATIKTGPQYAQDVHIRDWLPGYVNYVYGSTTVDGARYADGIATGNNNSSLALGTLQPNRTYVVRFEATVSGAPNVTLTNSVNVHVSGLADQNRTSTVRITGSSATPTPYVTPYVTPYLTPTPVPSASSLTMSLAGVNRTRGQTAEAPSVRARANDTMEFIFRIRNAGSGYLTNVMVTDYLPAGLRYAPGTTTLNGYATGDGITSSGLNIGALPSGQTATVKFSATADAASVPSWGEVVIINRVQVRADNAASVAAQMTVTLGRNVSIASVSSIQTGPADSILLSLLVAFVATGGYALYTRTNRYGRRLANAEIRAVAGRPLNFLG